MTSTNLRQPQYKAHDTIINQTTKNLYALTLVAHGRIYQVKMISFAWRRRHTMTMCIMDITIMHIVSFLYTY